MMPVEIKSRVSGRTQASAKERLKRVLGADDFHSHRKYYFRMNADDVNLYKLIGDSRDKQRFTKELYQMMHHTSVYGANACLLLIGLEKSLLYAVEVVFPTHILEEYNHITKVLYERHFKIFYSKEFDAKSFPAESINRALDQLNKGRKVGDRVSWHAFTTNYRLWRAINVEVDERAIRFPLPPMDMFLPCQNAEWNVSKGPSDTLTKLFDSCEEVITVRSPQTVSIARLLSVGGAAFH